MDIATVVTFIKEVLATFMTLLMMMSPALSGTAEKYTAERPDELVTSFAVVSDIHVETNFPESYNNLRNVLDGIKAGENVETVIYTGDNVMNGQLLESFFFYSAVRAVKPAENNFVLAGNHDFGNGEGNYEQLRKNYLINNEFYLGNKLDKEYFYRVVDGCYMVMLCSEDPNTSDFTMSRTQFEWLTGVLEEAKQADAPVFVFNHFPLRYLNPDKGSEITAQQLGDLLVNYGIELYVHGHIHNNIDGPDNFYKSYGVDCINLCRVTEVHEYEAGDGIVVEVYDDEVLVRTRDFIKGEWVEELAFSYPVD